MSAGAVLYIGSNESTGGLWAYGKPAASAADPKTKTASLQTGVVDHGE